MAFSWTDPFSTSDMTEAELASYFALTASLFYLAYNKGMNLAYPLLLSLMTPLCWFPLP